MPALANRIYTPMLVFAYVFLLLFTRSYLDLARSAPVWDHIFRFWIAGTIGACVIGLLVPYRTAAVLGLGVNIPSFFLLSGAALMSLIRGSRPARFYAIACTSFMVTALVRFLALVGILPVNLLTTYAVYSGILLMLVLLSFGLADRINALRDEKEAAQAEANAALLSRNEELLRLDRLKDDFLANTSHELRTPLNGIIGITESLLAGVGGSLNGIVRENMSLVAASGRRLSSLVNDVLDFSRVRHGDIALERRAVDLAAAVNVVLALSRPLLNSKSIELIADIGGDIPPVLADENRLQQILHNLVGNGIKFTKEGAVIVSAHLAMDTGMVAVTVADTGIGIPVEKQRAIFESFTQADGSVSREYGGTGLGLAITRKLVELHGGTIQVDSNAIEGARFVFTLPVATPQQGLPAEQPETTAREVPFPGAHRLDESAVESAVDGPLEPGAMHALIVDDDPVNLKVLRNHLLLQKIGVSEARSGRGCLQLLSTKRFDLVLLDVMMPGLSGYEVCRIIRETHSHSELPVIMLTARNRVADLVTGLESGANDYLVKPFDSRELLARVQTMLELKRAARSQSDLAAMQTELDLARRIQHSLLPSELPRVAGLTVAARYRSMDMVGGDFYDFRVDESGALAVLMADVSGHGVPAALIVSMVNLAFQFQRDNLQLPDRVLAGMNEVLDGNVGSEFVSACYASVDPVNGVLRTGNAGHPPLIVLRSSGEVVKLRPPGRLLGIFPLAEFETEEVALEGGDRILLYTDGAFEASRSDGEQFGEERLLELLLEGRVLSADELAEHVIEQLVQWCGGAHKIDDDIALVVVDVAR